MRRSIPKGAPLCMPMTQCSWPCATSGSLLVRMDYNLSLPKVMRCEPMGSVSQEAMLAGMVEAKKHVTVTSPYDVKSIFGPQGQRLIPTVRHDMCGTTGLSACFVYMPPGRVARAHVHNH